MSDEIKQYTFEELQEELNEKQKIFCHAYVIDWNKTRSYKKAYGEKDDNVAAVSGFNLLRIPKIKQYCDFIKNNLEEESGISKLRNLQELAKIAYSSISHLHNDWIELNDWEAIKKSNPEAMSAIESIDTKTEQKSFLVNGEAENIDIKYVKIKLFSKTTAIDVINKMMDYYTAEKREITGKGGKDLIPPRVLTAEEAKQLWNDFDNGKFPKI